MGVTRLQGGAPFTISQLDNISLITMAYRLLDNIAVVNGTLNRRTVDWVSSFNIGFSTNFFTHPIQSHFSAGTRWLSWRMGCFMGFHDENWWFSLDPMGFLRFGPWRNVHSGDFDGISMKIMVISMVFLGDFGGMWSSIVIHVWWLYFLILCRIPHKPNGGKFLMDLHDSKLLNVSDVVTQ